MPKFHTFICPADQQESANQFWIDAQAGPDTFSVPLVPLDGPANAQPATHFIASSRFEQLFGAAVIDLFESQFPTVVSLPFEGTSAANLAYVNGELIARNLQRYTPQV